MARVWREGQKREVFVYRLIAADRIEDEILEVSTSHHVCNTHRSNW
jgi:SNF2 family DNA or RNA helicase